MISRMKQKYLGLLLLLLFVFVPFSKASAQFDYPTQPPPMIGGQAYYSVVFRGNQEALVSLKTIVTNHENFPLTTLKLTLPEVTANNITAYQVLAEPICIRYHQQPIPLQREDTKPQSSSLIAQPEPYPMPQPQCAEYQNPDFSNYWYGNITYQKASTTVQDKIVIVSLPKPIPVNESGSYVLYFKATGFVGKNIFGAYNYKFETVKTDQAVDNLQVGLTTDSEFIFRGQTGEVQYNNTKATMTSPSVGASEGIRSDIQFNTYYQQIGQGTIIKTTNGIQPGESYIVSGQFAKSYWQLYVKEALVFVLAALLLIFLSVIFGPKLYRRFIHPVVTNTTPATQMQPFVLSLGTSFVTSLVAAGYTLLVYFAGTAFSLLFNSYYRFEFIIMIFFVLISICVYALLLFAPAVLIGMKRGLVWGVATIGLTVGWLVFYLFITVIILFLTQQRPDYPTPMPYPAMREGGVEQGSTQPAPAVDTSSANAPQ